MLCCATLVLIEQARLLKIRKSRLIPTIYNSNVIDDRLISKNFYSNLNYINADYINNGTSNQFIVNNYYDNDLTITGTLIVSRLMVLGIETPEYTNEPSSNISFDIGTFDNYFSTKNIDQLSNGTSNQFITNGIYNNDLFVSGTLTVSRLQVLGIDLQGDYDYTQPPYYPSQPYYYNSNITTDTITKGEHNKFIIDDVYDSSLTVTGTLVVSRLIVLGLDIPDYEYTTNATSNIAYNPDNFITDFNNLFITKTTDNLIEGVHNKYIKDGVYSNDLVITGTLFVSKLEVIGIETDGFNIESKVSANIPFYMSLYLSNDTTIYDNDHHQLNFNTLNTSINWVNNYFIPPKNGIYVINYSIMGKINSWINKGENFNDITKRYSMNFNNNIYSTSYILNATVNDKWCIVVKSPEASYINPITLYRNYENYGESKLEIMLLQSN